MLVCFIACRCAMDQTRLKSDDYTCRTVRKRLMDGGSNPPSSTNNKTPTRLSWGFFLGDRACCPVLLRVPAERCGPRPPHLLACSAPGSLSTGHFSQRVLRTVTARSPQDQGFGVKRINNLRVDESSSLISALAGARMAQPGGFRFGSYAFNPGHVRPIQQLDSSSKLIWLKNICRETFIE